MTAQVAERIIVDGRPQPLFADPLRELVERHKIRLGSPYLVSTSNYRGYVGTWEILDARFCLVRLDWPAWNDSGRLELPISDAVRRRLLRAAKCDAFPIHAHWFNGVVRMAVGKRLIYGHLGWSHWFERQRIVHVKSGAVVRDRDVDTRAMLERWLRRHPEDARRLLPDNREPLGPLCWFDTESGAERWPPDYVRVPDPDRS